MKHFLTTYFTAVLLLFASTSSYAEDLTPDEFLSGAKTDRFATLSLSNGRTFRGVKVIKTKLSYQSRTLSWVKISYSSQLQGLSEMRAAGKEETWVHVNHICSVKFQPVIEKPRDEKGAIAAEAKSVEPKPENK